MSTTTYLVVDGDDGPSIAARFGFASFDSIIDHPANDELRARRPNTNQLFPGDVVHVPERERVYRPAKEKAESKFVLTVPRRTVHVLARERDGSPVADVPYVLSGPSGVVATGTTAADGAVRADVPVELRKVTLSLGTTSTILWLGALNPMHNTPDEGRSGCAQRLRALGYASGPADGSDEAMLGDAILRFKADQNLPDPEVALLTEELFDALLAAYGQ